MLITVDGGNLRVVELVRSNLGQQVRVIGRIILKQVVELVEQVVLLKIFGLILIKLIVCCGSLTITL